MLSEAEPHSQAEIAESLPIVGRYSAVRRIGRGGFADVYLARHPESGALVALKVLREDIDGRVRDQVRTRFLAEEAIARAIDHPAVVRIRETSGRGQRPCFMAMDFVDGLPFCDYFERLRKPDADEPRLGELAYFAEVARLGHEIARAMTAAHARGIVHRDLKPDNVLIQVDGGVARARILDFGIAKAPAELFSLERVAAVTRYYTELGTVMGSPPYMAPEQNGAAHAVSGKADVFALGVMLFVALVGIDHHALEMGVDRLTLPAEFDERVRQASLPETFRKLLKSMVATDPDERPTMYEAALGLQRAARTDEKFGAAVEEWIQKGRVPSSRELVKLARVGEDLPHLTDDEQEFLRKAPLVRLQHLRRRVFATGVAVVVLVGASVAGARYAPADIWSGLPLDRLLDVVSKPQTTAPAAIAVPRPDPLREKLRELESALATQKTLIEQQERTSAEHQGTIRSLGASVAEHKRTREQALKQVEQADARAAAAERLVKDSRADADRQAQALAECRRDLEVHLGQLSESAERLRLCTRSLRESAGPRSSVEGSGTD